MPRIRSRLLGDSQATVAENVDLRNGSLRPIREPGFVQGIQRSQQSLYLHNGEFLTFETDVDVVRGPVIADAFDRIYFTGDGTPKVRGTIDGADQVFDLGVPAPTEEPFVTPVAKSAGGFTRNWFAFYEEPDGRQVDTVTLVEGVDIIEKEAGTNYIIEDFELKFPKSPSTSAEAIFVLLFDAFDSGSGAALGRLYSNISTYTGNNDFVLDGAAGTMNQDNTDDAEVFIAYDTSRASDYTVDRAYVYTFVTVFGEEGPPSPPSAVTSIDPTEDANITNLKNTFSGNIQVVAKRIYRTVTGTAGSAFQFVAEIPVATDSFLDELADAQTAEALPSADWDPPPSDLFGIVSMAGGFFAAFRPGGKDIYFSESAFPHAWPSEFRIGIDYPIVGLGAHENSLLIATEGFPYLATGVAPQFMTLQRLLVRHACVSKRSITNIGNAIAYASNDGVVLNVGADITLVSKRFYTEEEWQLTDPTTMIGSYEDDRLFMFSDTTMLIFEFDDQRSLLVTTDERIDGAYNDIETDTLFMIQGSSITSWEGGEQIKPLQWRSKRIVFSRVGDFSTARILADGYPLTLRLFAEGAQVHEQQVLNDESFTLPTLRQEREWNVELESTFTITELTLADRRGLRE